MKYEGIRKIHEGRFITRYDVDYTTAEGNAKTYEIISRNKDIQTLEELQNIEPDSVILILTDISREKILVNREYRMAMAQWIYNFPAGLIDPGESAEESAARELREETGLELIRIDDVLDGSYNARPVDIRDRATNYWWGMISGVVDIKLSDELPLYTGKLVRVLKQDIINGSFNPFDTELRSQEGIVRTENDSRLESRDIIQMDWLNENIVGEIPAMDALTDEAKTTVKYSGVEKSKGGIV